MPLSHRYDANHPLNILLVEDDDGDAQALQRAFRKAKITYSLVRAVDGVAALELLQSHDTSTASSSDHRVLLVDLNMPRMSGTQLVSAIRADERLHRSIIFILTTSKREEDKMAAYDLNVAGYIAKATAGEDFSNLINLLDLYSRIVEIP
jgi:CheY-like chemotaxis protein